VDELDGLEIRHLRYFLTVARTGKISAASQELNIAQPSLSQLIQRLERRLGITLFARNARGVELTAAGEVFRHGVERILEQLRMVLAQAGSAPRMIRIGVCSGVMPVLLTEIEDAIAGSKSSLSPEQQVETVLRWEPTSRQVELLRLGELDLGIVRLPIDDPSLDIVTVSDQELGVVLHSSHPLAVRNAVTWHDLQEQRLLWFDLRRAPGYARGLLAELDRRGWHPQLLPVDNDRRALFAHMLRTVKDLVALRPEADVNDVPQLVWRPILEVDVPREQLGLAAVRDSGHAVMMREIARSRHWPIHSVDTASPQ